MFIFCPSGLLACLLGHFVRLLGHFACHLGHFHFNMVFKAAGSNGYGDAGLIDELMIGGVALQVAAGPNGYGVMLHRVLMDCAAEMKAGPNNGALVLQFSLGETHASFTSITQLHASTA